VKKHVLLFLWTLKTVVLLNIFKETDKKKCMNLKVEKNSIYFK